MMPQDVIDIIQDDHARFRRLFAEVNEVSADQRPDLFRHLVSELARHEAAEEAIVHPTLRDEVPGGQSQADAVLHEENAAEQLLAEMEDLDATTSEFLTRFQELEQSVLSHADHEEAEEHPRLREHLDANRRQEMGTGFEKVKEGGPTHPHPNTPQSPEVRAAVGPLAGMFDQARDAVRNALSR